jgi:hypothetical protein
MRAGMICRPRGIRYAEELGSVDVMMLMTEAANRPIVIES